MNEIAKLQNFPLTKTEIAEYVEAVKDQIQARGSLELLARLTALETIVKEVKDLIKEQVLSEATYEGGRSFETGGVKYELASRKSYTYKHCPAWNELNEKIKALETLMKSTDREIADTETGEVIPPAQWSQTDYIKVTLPKQ